MFWDIYTTYRWVYKEHLDSLILKTWSIYNVEIEISSKYNAFD